MITAGPLGFTGAPGATGPQGFSGGPGATGWTGPSGFQGDTGPIGGPGRPGFTGSSGATGATGFTGVLRDAVHIVNVANVRFNGKCSVNLVQMTIPFASNTHLLFTEIGSNKFKYI